MQAGETKAVDVLNSFLRGEISAVETYRQAIDKVEKPTVRTQLEECLRSHELRVDVITRRVQASAVPPKATPGYGASSPS